MIAVTPSLHSNARFAAKTPSGSVTDVPVTPPIAEDRRFWSIFALAMAVAVASPVLPPLVGSVDAGWNVRWSYCLAAIWIVLQVVAIVRHRWRGPWLLLALPIVLWWPIGFRIWEHTCHQKANACP